MKGLCYSLSSNDGVFTGKVTILTVLVAHQIQWIKSEKNVLCFDSLLNPASSWDVLELLIVYSQEMIPPPILSIKYVALMVYVGHFVCV